MNKKAFTCGACGFHHLKSVTCEELRSHRSMDTQLLNIIRSIARKGELSCHKSDFDFLSKIKALVRESLPEEQVVNPNPAFNIKAAYEIVGHNLCRIEMLNKWKDEA